MTKIERTSHQLSEKNNIRLIWTFTVAGLVFAAAGIVMPPLGEIHGSVLGVVGECFVMVGGLAGIGVYANHQINNRIRIIRKEMGLGAEPEETEENDEEQ